jgi:hypothetical protein
MDEQEDFDTEIDLRANVENVMRSDFKWSSVSLKI